MSNYTITHAVYVAEQARRTEPKVGRTRCSAMLAGKDLRVPKAQRKAVEAVLMQMGTADLADAVELLTPAPAQAAPAPAPTAPKAPTPAQLAARERFAEAAKARKGTGVGGSVHTEARKAATAYQTELKALGQKITYREACLAFGTLPAGELAQVGMAGLAQELAARTA